MVSASGGFLLLAIPMAMGGAGFGLFMAPTAHLIIGAVPADRAASAGALVSSTRFVGQALGAALASALLATAFGTGPAPAFVAAGLALTSAGFSLTTLLRGRRAKPSGQTEIADVQV